MTHYELFGPWTGNALHAPPTPKRFRNRAGRLALVIVLAMVSVAAIGTMLWLSNH